MAQCEILESTCIFVIEKLEYNIREEIFIHPAFGFWVCYRR